MGILQTMNKESSVDLALTSFGFTELESRLYCELLRTGSASGYRLAQRVGKAAANVYQSLNSLTQKGAVLVSDDLEDTRTYSPVSPQQLMKTLKDSFEERHTDALAKLKAVYTPQNDERVYSVQGVQQIFERARTMLASAKEIVLIDFFPEIYDLLREDVEAVRSRGVTVAGIAYRPGDAGADMPLNKDAAELVSSRWPGLGLIIIADGRQYLVAQLSRDMTKVLNGVWTDSVFLSCVFHSAVAADIRLVALRADASDPLRHLSLQGSTPPGLKSLLNEQDH
ncbi:hypothetical protein ASE90_11220 [Sphingomonas sp. Leaf67]|uniref:TrmB family transcriptional regulator n=1 Tax=unclassified Sphingomonas TaxID=196159 RepID=UPI0006F67EC6|nr:MULTISPECIES: TrmB family transcriptional regulator [unclassified Sphingomonas]KQM79601.1 hypothetical protein ASE70_18835 [Sphingomonas sp. Leaf22]KQN82244.1 hypothetical protein ASE90_11220 [Sphingomonas sp. Leaf67]